VHASHRFQSGCRTNRKIMHSKGTNPREIFGSDQKNGKKFKDFTVEYTDRNKNSKADKLVKVAACNNPLPVDVFLQTIIDASIKTIEPEPKVINIVQSEAWRAQIIAYLCHYYEPDSTVEQT
jgi:hypothetical protein